MAGLTRGTLPPSVYWRRRLFVLGLLVAVAMLATGVVRGVTGSPDDSTGSGTPDVAEQAAAQPTASSEPSPSTIMTTESAQQPTKSPLPAPLPGPQGDCSPSDVVAEPVVGNAVAGRDVPIILKLRTELALACTFKVSPTSLTLKISSGSDEVWASRHCRMTIPEQVLVVRRDTYARMSIRWDAKRSDEGCSKLTQWALPGWYHVAAATLGGEPTEVKFELVRPTAATVSPGPKPAPAPKATATARPTKTAEPELHETER